MNHGDDSPRGQLEEAREALLAHAQARPATPPATRRGSPPGIQRALTGLAVVWVLVAWAWISRPAMIFGPDQSTNWSAVEREALARHALYLARARVEEFRSEHGRLPSTLDEAGVDEDDLRYRAAAPDFTVVFAIPEGSTLELTSRMDADSFLGDARARLPRPVRQ